jgi:hypothetical protein
MSDEILAEDSVERVLENQFQQKVIEQKDGESFEEMCKRLGLNPHCVCTFGKECNS